MNRLKILRCEKGLVQKDISNYLHCSIAIISMYEKEQRVMDINTAQKLASYFDCSVDYLLGKSDIRNDKDFIVLNDFYTHTMDDYEKYVKKYNFNRQIFIKLNKPNISTNKFQFLSNYDKLNDIGKTKINEIIEDLLQLDKYTKELNES